MTKIIALLAAATLSGAAALPAPDEAGVALWRLDCGSVEVKDLGAFSDTGLYSGRTKTLTASCYLVRNGGRFLLWDTGIDGSLAGGKRNADGNGLDEKLVTQLQRIGVSTGDIDYVGISHFHLDHTGQVADFPASTLLIGEPDWKLATSWSRSKPRFAHWESGAGKVEPLKADKDVFGDGTAVILKMPGHTDGHQSLLVRLASGAVLITGDQYHFAENRKAGGVPSFNMDRAATLASHDRFEKIAANLKAKVIIQHEPGDIAKLPVFPTPAR